MQAETSQLRRVEVIHERDVCSWCDCRVQDPVGGNGIRRVVKRGVMYVCRFGDVEQVCLSDRCGKSMMNGQEQSEIKNSLVRGGVVITPTSVAIPRKRQEYSGAHEMDLAAGKGVALLFGLG